MAQEAQGEKQAWYFNGIVVVLLLVVFFPVGLYLMWKGGKFSPKARWIITGVIGLFVLISAMGDKNKAAPTATAQANAPERAAPSRPEPDRTQAAAPEPEKPTASPVTESCYDLSTKFGTQSKLSDLQKDELWKEYRGRPFEWQLQIVEVSSGLLGGFTVQAKCSPKSPSLIQDIQLSYGGDAKAFVMGLEKDSAYKIRGTLKRQSTLLGMSADGIQ